MIFDFFRSIPRHELPVSFEGRNIRVWGRFLQERIAKNSLRSVIKITILIMSRSAVISCSMPPGRFRALRWFEELMPFFLIYY